MTTKPELQNTKHGIWLHLLKGANEIQLSPRSEPGAGSGR